MISGKAKKLFLKWLKYEKLLTGFYDKPIYTQIFLLCEWFQTQGYAISTTSSYYDFNYTAKISFKQGDIITASEDSLEKIYIVAIEYANREFNDRFSKTD